MALRAPGSLSSSLPPEELSWRAEPFFLGDFALLRLVPDLRFEVGGPIFSFAADVDLAGDLEADTVDVADLLDLGCFGVVVALAVGCGPALAFAMEADLVFMNPASVG